MNTSFPDKKDETHDDARRNPFTKTDSRILLAISCLLCFIPAGCRSMDRAGLDRYTGGNAFLYRQFQAYDGRTGRPLTFEQIAQKCRQANVVLFGEEHGNPICNQLEAQLLYELSRGDRRGRNHSWGLALEFFEADTQEALDAYARGRLTEAAFLELTKRRPDYWHSHRSLVELSRAAGAPLIAANAPRRLVRAYRRSGLLYEEFRATLPPEDQRWLPVTNVEIGGAYLERFAETMRSHAETPAPPVMPESPTAPSAPESQPLSESSTNPTNGSTGMVVNSDSNSTPPTQSATHVEEQTGTSPAPVIQNMPPEMPSVPTWQELYKAQLLWDQAMAEALAHSREVNPGRGVLLIVGGFHVAHDGGTFQKFRMMRPNDRLVTIIFRSHDNVEFTFQSEDRNAGDIVIYGLTPPSRESAAAMPVRPSETSPAPPASPVDVPGEPTEKAAESMEHPPASSLDEIPAEGATSDPPASSPTSEPEAQTQPTETPEAVG